jgi:hypothetical protein
MIGIAILVGVISIFVIATFLNGRTEIPEECRELADECASCHGHSHSIGE